MTDSPEGAVTVTEGPGTVTLTARTPAGPTYLVQVRADPPRAVLADPDGRI